MCAAATSFNAIGLHLYLSMRLVLVYLYKKIALLFFPDFNTLCNTIYTVIVVFNVS